MRVILTTCGLLSLSSSAFASEGTCTSSETESIGTIGNQVQSCIEASGESISASVIANCAVDIGGLSTTCADCVGDVIYRLFLCNNLCDGGEDDHDCMACRKELSTDYVVNEATGAVTMCNATIEEDRGENELSGTTTPPSTITAESPVTTVTTTKLSGTQFVGVTASSLTLILLVITAVI